MRLWGIALLVVICNAFAADEPEVVYGKFHRAIAAGNLEEMMRHAPAARRAEVAAMSAAQKDAQIKMLSMLMPKAFTLVAKRFAPGGRNARLIVTGPGETVIAGGAREPMYGRVRMVQEGGEWKVDEIAWSNEPPSAGEVGPAVVTPPGAAAAKPVSASRQAPRTAAPAALPPARKLGEAKPDCVYKPVMTNEDMERCR
jgi:hypothetical protein